MESGAVAEKRNIRPHANANNSESLEEEKCLVELLMQMRICI